MSDSARRYPKKPAKLKSDLDAPAADIPRVQLKTKEPLSKDGLFKDFFGRDKSTSDLPATQSKASPESIRIRQTLSTPAQRMPDVTSPSQLRPRPQKKRPAPVAITQSKSSSLTPIRVALVAIVLLLVWFGTQGPSFNRSSDVPLQALSPQEQVDSLKRVELHREEIGHRLNRDRITVEYQNNVSAPPLKTNQKGPADPDVMAGAPLKPEGLHRSTSRDRLEPLNPEYADAHVEYSLQEQAAANDWEAKAQKQYVDEFVANAAKAGYKIKVEKGGVVKVLGQTPQAAPVKPYNGELGPLPRDPSSAGALR